MSSTVAWPAIAGSFQVGDPDGPVAVCALTSDELIAPLASVAGVAIAGKVYTANLGIERIVLNVTANPAIRFLLICGKDSPLFHPGQSLVALAEHGLDAERRIIGASGYDPVLPTLPLERVARFRRQIEALDWSGESELSALAEGIRGLVARNPGRFVGGEELDEMATFDERFVAIRPGGQREPLQYDPKGYFVITLDRDEEQIVLRHYLPDHTPAHEMRGRVAGSMLLGLLREGLVTQLSHAGYLGEELAKAQAGLLLGLRYDQDRPLRPREPASNGQDDVTPTPRPAPQEPANAPAEPVAMPRITQSLSGAQLQATQSGAVVDVVIVVTQTPEPNVYVGTLLEPDEAEPFNAFRRTARQVSVHRAPESPIIMGGPDDFHIGALIRAKGVLREGNQVDAERVVILTRVGRIVEP
jgi:tetrahydromethanopterin S-methyltransferase subunit A